MADKAAELWAEFDAKHREERCAQDEKLAEELKAMTPESARRFLDECAERGSLFALRTEWAT